MKEIIITGSSGFVGKNLSEYLMQTGYKITPISLRNDSWEFEISKDAYAIIHLAGLAHDLKNTRKKEEYFSVNTDLTIKLYDIFYKSNISKFIYFSTVKAVADSLENEVLDENYPAFPVTPYGQSKHKAEEYILKNLSEDKKSYILRPCMIHGPANKGNLNLLYQFVSIGIPYPLAAFENQRSFLSIDNLNFIVQNICELEIASGVYNVSDSEFLSTIDVVSIMNECIGKKPKLWSLNKKTITFVAEIGSKLSLPFNLERLNKLTESYKVSNAKLLSAIQQNMPVRASEGIKKTINSFKK